jgi:hypothetical protein
MPFIWAVRVATLPLTTRGEAGKDAARWPVAPLDSLSRKPLTHTMTGLWHDRTLTRVRFRNSLLPPRTVLYSTYTSSIQRLCRAAACVADRTAASRPQVQVYTQPTLILHVRGTGTSAEGHISRGRISQSLAIVRYRTELRDHQLTTLLHSTTHPAEPIRDLVLLSPTS